MMMQLIENYPHLPLSDLREVDVDLEARWAKVDHGFGQMPSFRCFIIYNEKPFVYEFDWETFRTFCHSVCGGYGFTRLEDNLPDFVEEVCVINDQTVLSCAWTYRGSWRDLKSELYEMQKKSDRLTNDCKRIAEIMEEPISGSLQITLHKSRD